MKNIKMLLLPLAIIFELFLLLVCWMLAVVHPVSSKKLHDWVDFHLPSKEWYFDNLDTK